MGITRAQALEVVAAALAAESGCRPEDFAGGGVHVAELARTRDDDPRRRRFPRSEHSLGELGREPRMSGAAAARSRWIAARGRSRMAGSAAGREVRR